MATEPTIEMIRSWASNNQGKFYISGGRIEVALSEDELLAFAEFVGADHAALLSAAQAVTAKWADMRECYSSTEESVELAELLDALANAVKGEADV